MKDLDGSASRLAGALGLDETYKLHQLYSSVCPATKAIIDRFIADRQNDFRHPNLLKNCRAVRAHTVINGVERAGQFTAAPLDSMPLTLTSQNVNEDNLFDIRQLW